MSAALLIQIWICPCRQRGVFVNNNHIRDGKATCNWWLRSISKDYNAWHVTLLGTIDIVRPNQDNCGVRPVICLDLDKLGYTILIEN